MAIDFKAPTQSGANAPLRSGRATGRRTTLVKVVVAVLLCSAVGFVYVQLSDSSNGNGVEGDPSAMLVHEVQRGDFEAFVTESGDIESANNVEVRCEVKSPGGSGGTTILEIIEEGTAVTGPRQIQVQGNERPEELAERYEVSVEALQAANSNLETAIANRESVTIPGDLLVQFDDAALQISLTEQEIQVAMDDAAVIDVQSELNKATQILNEYKQGLFLVDKELYEGDLFQAESHLKYVEDSLMYSQRMFRKGFITAIQLEAENLSVEMARKAVQAARIKLDVHTEFTRERMIGEYEADIEKQKANLKAAQFALKLSQQRRDELLDQIAKCRVHAPAPGQVVYANDFERSNNIVIEEGAQIREGQVVIRLPNPQEMKVKARINDSKIKQVTVGNSVTIELDVNPNLPVRGEVSKVNPFPYPRQWYGGPIEYGTEIRIVDPPPGLTPGQRAKVRIFVDRADDVVQVPIQSVVERSGSHYCLVQAADGNWMTRQVSIGTNNGSFVVLHDGVDEGEQVALNPDLLWDKVYSDEKTAEQPSGVADSNADRADVGS